MPRPTSDFADEDFVEEDENDADIVIVGAGLTGLSCAYNILRKESGLEVIIVEANNEIGGRILSQDCSESFHANTSQKHVTHLADTLRVNTYPRRDVNNKKDILYAKNGPKQNLPRFCAAEAYYFLQTVQKSTLDSRFEAYDLHEGAEEFAVTSVETLVRRLVCFPYARSLCRAFIYSTCGIRNLDEVSTLWLLVMLNGAQGLFNRLKVTLGDDNRYFMKGGAFQIARELLKKIVSKNGQIRYLEPVSEINFNDDRAYVHTKKHCFRCEFVVVAIPPPQNNNITIQPSLPEQYLKIQSHYTQGRNIFFNIAYAHPFWSNKFTGNILTTLDANTNLNLTYDATHGVHAKKSVLAGYIAEPNSCQSFNKDLFETVHDCFESTEVREYLKYAEYNSLRADTRDAAGIPMSAMKPSCVADHVNLIDSPYERIFFASSEYARNWPGTVDGAIQAGEIAAYSMLSRLRPQAVSYQEMAEIMPYRKIQNEWSFEIFAIQYLGLGLNIAIFLHFLRNAYTNT